MNEGMRTPGLWSFVGIYFNQDWPEDYGSEEASVNAFLVDAPEERDALIAELEWVLQTYADEAALEAYLDELGNEYLPPLDRGGYRGWLTRVTDLLRAPIGSTSPSP